MSCEVVSGAEGGRVALPVQSDVPPALAQCVAFVLGMSQAACLG